MSKLLIGDVHLGLRFPFTTPESQLKFRQLQLDTVAAAKAVDPEAHVVFLGDLFDKYSVSDTTLIDGYNLLDGDSSVLAGNHDLAKNEDKPSAIKLLAWELGKNVLMGGASIYSYSNDPDSAVVSHCLTQDEFETACISLTNTGRSQTDANLVLMHCNFGTPNGTDTENYLTPEMAKKLIGRFKQVVAGHEHNFRQPIPGVTMLGSILPMNFGEMADKFVALVDDASSIQLIKVWDAAKYYKQLTVAQAQTFVPTEEHFLEVVGTVTVDEAVLVNKRIKDWYKAGVIAVKNSTQLLRTEREVEHKADGTTWEAEVAAQLTEDQQALFTEILEACHA